MIKRGEVLTKPEIVDGWNNPFSTKCHVFRSTPDTIDL